MHKNLPTMASGSRNYSKPSAVHGFDSPHGADKMVSSTLKRQPSPEWSKTDLLRLLSHFEGELQARDISIATLKADKAKQLLYQAKYGRFGLGDPFVALQRDAEGKNDTGFDEAAIKSMYDNQLAQLENLIATQRKAQLKMREQLGNSEKRFHKLCSELEDEKQKHAQDTAQGDDVTYMLEKERERLRAEIDFEKSQNKKLEKDLKKTLVGLEEEKSNAARHKQVAIMLIKERKHLIENIIAENKLRDEAESALHSEKSKTVNMAEGLAQESKKSLKMEMAMEKQHSDFDSERDSLKKKLLEEELHTKNLRAEVARLTKQLEGVHQQLKTTGGGNSLPPPPSSTAVHTRSSSSPARSISSKGSDRMSPSPYGNPSPQQQQQQVQSVSPSSYAHPYNNSQQIAPPSAASVSAAVVAAAASKGHHPPSSSHQLMPAGGAIRPGMRSSTKVVDGGRIGSSSPEREVIHRPDNASGGGNVGGVGVRRSPAVGSSSSMSNPTGVRVAPIGAATAVSSSSSSSLSHSPSKGRGGVGDRLEVDVGSPGQCQGPVLSPHMSPGASSTGGAGGGVSKIPYNTGSGGMGAQSHYASNQHHLQYNSAGSHLQRKGQMSSSSPSPSASSSLSMGRGTPPPIPPNKPNFGPTPPGPVSKPWPPPKVSVGSSLGHHGSTVRTGAVQIPVNFVSGGGGGSSSSPGHQHPHHQHHASPSPPSSQSQSQTAGGGVGGGGKNVVASVRTQCVVDSLPLHGDVNSPSSSSTPLNTEVPESPALEFLGPEMANLHELLASMTTSEENNNSKESIKTDSPPPQNTSSPVITTQPSASTASKHSSKKTLLNDNHSTNSPPSSRKEAKNNSVNKLVLGEDGNPIPKMGFPQANIPFTTTSDFTTPTMTSAATVDSNSQLHPSNIISSVSSPAQSQNIILSSPNSPAISVNPKSFNNNNNTLPQLMTNIPNNTTNNASPQLSIITRNHSQNFTNNTNTSSSSVNVVKSTISGLTSGNTPSSQSSSLSSTSSFSSPGQNINESITSSSSSLVRPTPVILLEKSTMHSLVVRGDVQALHNYLREQQGGSGGMANANMQLVDGTTLLHVAVEYNQEACVRLLLDTGAKASCLRDDRITPLHIAAAKGYAGCVRLLLSKGAAVNISAIDSVTPLHLAVKGLHLDCCTLLLRHGANVLYTGKDSLTSLHYAVQSCQPEILQVLLDRLKLNGTTRDSNAAHMLVAITDEQGWSIAHMAAHLPTQECLIKLAESLPLDFSVQDKLGCNVREVSSPTCQFLLADIDRPSNPSLKAQVELHYYLAHSFVSSAQIGVVDVNPGINWHAMEERLRAVLKSYLAQLDVGLKSRRINRLDMDLNWMDKDFTLGLTMNNIKHYEMGFYTWTPGMQTDTSPYLILCNNEQKRVTIIVDDTTNMCDLIAFDILHPVASVSNYLRLLEQYKSVIFYGPMGCGKSYLAHRLAQWIAAQENSKGKKPSIYQLTLNPGFTFNKFLAFLKQRGCVVPVRKDPDNQVPILLLDNLETVDIAKLFGELLDPIEYRGIGHAFCLRGDDEHSNGMHYFQDNFYVIGTMNKSRSLGVDLSILPRFRWIQFRLDTEPLRGLLARHFLRRLLNLNHGCLPSQENGLFRTIEWVVCFWQRLNDSLIKLGLPEVIMGPCSFFKCPLEKQDTALILDWVKGLWNQQVAPRVREAVKRGTGSEAPSDGQQKVANTALYVLMQRSVILGCPLGGQEKESYLSGFCGSNELDIPLKSGVGGASNSNNNIGAGGGDGRSRYATPLMKGQLQQQHQKPQEVLADNSSSPVNFSSSKERNGRDQMRTFFMSSIKRRSLSESSVSKAAQMEEQEQQQQQAATQQQQQQKHPHPDLPHQNLHLTTTDMNSNLLLSQAKVARLEVKSPKLLTIPAALRSSSSTPTRHLSSSKSSSSSPSLSTFSSSSSSSQFQFPKKTGRVSPLYTPSSSSSSSASPKKSRSSENISSSNIYPGFPKRGGSNSSPSSPFSFSLATPTSKLSSFKMFDPSYSGGGEEVGDYSNSLLQEMPDFSIFNKVSSPTEELSSSRGFVFVGQRQEGSRNNNNNNDEEEVWSRREDVFVPISSTANQIVHKGRDV